MQRNKAVKKTGTILKSNTRYILGGTTEISRSAGIHCNYITLNW
jgi:hypothetical protein